MTAAPEYILGDNQTFIIENHHLAPPFASFLPGIAGKFGRPLWAFYVNRGQGVISCGIRNKDSAILPFIPADQAWQQVGSTGFRTFIKLTDSPDSILEPFRDDLDGSWSRMTVAPAWFSLERKLSNLHFLVRYTILPDEPLAGLIRTLTVTNHGSSTIEFELLDGLPRIVPYGVNHFLFKEMSRTISAWMGVEYSPAGIPLYKTRSSIEDRPEVSATIGGYFYLGCAGDGDIAEIQSAIVDPALIFHQDTSLSQPRGFAQSSLSELTAQNQISLGRIPCGFFGDHRSLSSGQSTTWQQILGYTPNTAELDTFAQRMCKPGVLEQKMEQSQKYHLELTNPILTRSGNPAWDAYARQCYLDNGLRGGFPSSIGTMNDPHSFYLYGRKHGDLERDYNFFQLEPEFWSQGDGNYRDVNQNRRCDNWFHPQTGAYNLELFLNLIQLDGYNPLVLQGTQFHFCPSPADDFSDLVDHPQDLNELLKKPFTPGTLFRDLAAANVLIKGDHEVFLTSILSRSAPEHLAAHGEGFWVDHWTYNLDLIQNYLAQYPDRDDLLFEDHRATYYDSAWTVQPRSLRYNLTVEGPRQTQAVKLDEEKQAILNSRSEDKNLMRSANGSGPVFYSSYFIKLLHLAAIKFCSLDPGQMGIEMEAGKPGWYDALNGMPGIFGASLSETVELRRLLGFLLDLVTKYPERQIQIPTEFQSLLESIPLLLISFESQYFWEAVNKLREDFRHDTRLGLSGNTTQIVLFNLNETLAGMHLKITRGLQKARDLNQGLLPTYIRWEPLDWQKADEISSATTSDRGIQVNAWKPHFLPLFLEGLIKDLKTTDNPDLAVKLHNQVLSSALYDPKLGMLKVNADLSAETLQIGRARAFPRGWLENESIFLHMQYKYLLAMLSAGLYSEFWQLAQTAMIPFRDPAQYGRSILENSSFLVSSAHVDPSLHGRGFVARLSGSTAEFLNIWLWIMFGKEPFRLQDKKLVLEFQPCLPAWLFPDNGILECTFLGKITVRHINPDGVNIYPDSLPSPVKIEVHDGSGNSTIYPHFPLPAEAAQQIRECTVTAIDIFWGANADRSISDD